MRNSPFWWVLIGCMLLLDLYVFQAVKLATSPANGRIRFFIHLVYWVISIAAVLLLIFLPMINQSQTRSIRSTFFAIIMGLFFGKLVAAIFFLVDDVRRGIQWIAGKLFFSGTETDEMSRSGISRSAFFSWLGFIAGGGVFGSLIYGFGNKYKYQLNTIELKFDNLPEPFAGLKVVQISDIHSGSFNNHAAVSRGVDMIMKQQPDLILFTGDLVNNVADEMKHYTDIFSRLKAPLGVYSVLGNHDYGDYVSWSTAEEKKANLDTLKSIHQNMGWRLLMNEHVLLERGENKIALLGIENWSAKARFPRHGDLTKAHAGTDGIPFKILMSHDPSHWDAEVRKSFPDIDLTLSGHTHGMQFGVEMPGFRWSPVQYMYEQWAGLYENGKQKLYVNRGYGFIGYPGRVGILPEITVFQFA